MIRSRRLTPALLDQWLVDQHVPIGHASYRLRVWRENQAALGPLRAELFAYLDEAFDDARRRLRHGFEDTLSPFNDPATDPAAHYPGLLHRITLQGYFGETLAGLAVEHWGAHGHADWIVPAFLFRFHEQEFQHLELISERLRAGEEHVADAEAEQRPGRTGDDAIAFRMNDQNLITDVLTLEAKCLSHNSNAKIAEAHAKLSNAGPLPSGILELINLLSEYDTAEANVWGEALLRLRHDGYRRTARYDGVAYACGQIPRRGGRIAWMPPNAPHAAYTVVRNLEGMEFQFENLPALIAALYRVA